MIDELHVRDYALVRDARLLFSSGCTVLSGETGAGKTALVGALKLLMGERGDVSAIRDGSTELLVEGRYVVAQTQTPAVPASEDDATGDATGDVRVQGGATGDAEGVRCTERVITRRLNREGRSRCTLDDGMVTVGALAEQVGPLIDLHGQHEHQSLLAPKVQLAYLDRFAGAKGLVALAAYRAAWDGCVAAAAALEALRQATQTSERTLAFAEQTVREMEAVNPGPTEYEDLEQQLPILRNGESLALASQTALDFLRGSAATLGSDGDSGSAGSGALDALAAAHRALVLEAGVDVRLDDLAGQLESLSITADDLATSLRAYRESVEFDPQALETALDRLGALEGLRKRYGPRMADVFTAWQEASEQLSLTGNLTERLVAAEQELARAQKELENAAAALAAARAQAASGFAKALSASLQDLAMEGASVEYAIQDLPRESWTATGSARYELMYRPGLASVPRPLAKIASGGELSRVMLALKTLFKSPDEQVTLVFDEVDAGIGGAAATAVARRIRSLASTQQVIVITHLAQIAAIADRQFVVEKSLDGGGGKDSKGGGDGEGGTGGGNDSPCTVIREVCGDERVAEIARMLSGSTDEVALEHARALLAGKAAL
ncbi:MAG: DNA repair protein RecN [Coriobacteriales bacterium]|jgi:DNA repair protein RecN (Recombination protein N)|nr:DNA repair protein RecN [Coriobacteriales bacterium]